VRNLNGFVLQHHVVSLGVDLGHAHVAARGAVRGHLVGRRAARRTLVFALLAPGVANAVLVRPRHGAPVLGGAGGQVEPGGEGQLIVLC